MKAKDITKYIEVFQNIDMENSEKTLAELDSLGFKMETDLLFKYKEHAGGKVQKAGTMWSMGIAAVIHIILMFIVLAIYHFTLRYKGEKCVQAP
jgi:hypothetical protein